MTPVIEKNIADMIEEANDLIKKTEQISDSLSQKDFDSFHRSIGYLKEAEVDFENLKQNK
jgi:hypothetical protein